MNENDLAQWLSEDDGKTDKKKLADDLHAYDRALYDAGVIKSMKYKGGIGARAVVEVGVRGVVARSLAVPPLASH